MLHTHTTHRARRQAVVVTEKGDAEVAAPIRSVMCGAGADSASEAPLQEMKGRTATAVMSLTFGMGGRFGGEKYLQWSDAKRIACQAKELESGVRECIAQLVSEYHCFWLKKKKKA